MFARVRRPLALVLAAGTALPLLACGSDDGSAAADGRVRVEAAFYPLAWVAEQVGGEHVAVRSLTPPGAEPHDLELTPSGVARVLDADLVVHLAGFQPAVDQAVGQLDGDRALDVTEAADLDLRASDDGHHHGDDDHGDEAHEDEGQDGHEDEADEHGHEAHQGGADDHGDDDADDHAGDAHEDEGDDHRADEAHEDEDGHDDDGHDDGGQVDRHFWLDPQRLAAVGRAVADRLAELDPDHRDDYEAGADALTTALTDLDGRYEAGLATCARRELVTSHQAFGYLARRYGLEQVGISGLSPEEEPSPADLAAVTRFVRDHGVTTIFFESLVSPAIARTVAAETGATTDRLDPIEGLTDDAEGDDYVEVMDANLEHLRTALGCS